MKAKDALLLLLSLAACAKSGDESSTAITIDTLPGGIIRTISHHPADSGQWQLVPVRTIDPPETSPGEIGEVQDIALADDGTLYLFDSKRVHITVFSAQGEFLRTIGRAGDGPREFRAGYLAIVGDTLAVQDPRAGKLSIFLTSNDSLLNQRPTACCNYGSIGVDGSGRAVVRSIIQPDSLHPSTAYVRASLSSGAVDTVRVSERPPVNGKRWVVTEGKTTRFEMQVPLRPRDMQTVDATGSFITGWSGEFLLRMTRNGQDTVSLFGRDLTPEPVSAEMKQRIVNDRVNSNKEYTAEATLRKAFDPEALPNQRPAYEWLWTDRAGRRWARVSRNDTTTVTLDLFDQAGRWLDQILMKQEAWPQDAWTPVSFSGKEVAVVLSGPDERSIIQIYRIERKR